MQGRLSEEIAENARLTRILRKGEYLEGYNKEELIYGRRKMNHPPHYTVGRWVIESQGHYEWCSIY